MAQRSSAVTVSVRILPTVRDQLEELADATGRTKSFLAAEAIGCYLSAHTWQVKAIETAVKKSKSKNAKFIEHKTMSNWLNSWGLENELDSPK